MHFGTPDLNPSLDIRAIHTVRQPRLSTNGRDVRVEVDITGSLAQPQLALRNPDNLPLSESDLLSYLVTGEPAVGLDQPGTQVANLGVRALGNIFTNAIRETSWTSSSCRPRLVRIKTTTWHPVLQQPAQHARVLGKQLGGRWFLA